MMIRNANPTDFADILKLNESFVHFLSPMSLARLAMLHEQAAYHRVMEESGHVVAFLIAFREGARYDSLNYRWFADRYPRFVYVDRMVIDERFHRRGLGTQLYEDLFAFAAKSEVDHVAAEVDALPPNPVSAKFHTKQGFTEVGTQFLNLTNKQVSMQMRFVASERSNMVLSSQSLVDKFALIQEHWRPKVVAELNGQEVKLVKFCGEFPWHRHENEDEMFLVWRGEMIVEFRDQSVLLREGEFCVVPRGVEHRTLAPKEAEVIVFEPAQTRNTGNIVDERFTAPNGVKL